MANETKNDGSSQPDDAYATSDTTAFIRALYAKYVEAKLRLVELEAVLTSSKDQMMYLSEEYQRVTADEKMLKAQLEQARLAGEKVRSLLVFFTKEVENTAQLVKHAHAAAQAMFTSLYQLNGKALGRVEKIKSLVLEATAEEASSWTATFVNSITETEAKGVAAFKAGAEATQETFKAYLSNQEIYARLLDYLKRFKQLEAELESVVTSKQHELSLLDQKCHALRDEMTNTEAEVSRLTQKVEAQTFMVAQLQAEYNAAQQGSEYKYVPPTAPAS